MGKKKYCDLCMDPSLASRLNGYMYSNDTSLNVALFSLMANHFVSRITLQLLGVKIIPCRVASLIDISVKTKGLGPVYMDPVYPYFPINKLVCEM